ncbi:cobaltochelatase CobT-related protein [Aestuariivirga sp.]|uniref:cobaltochelatase CobT-related protein n=1 Tax=Aestuariivirga sp. TaxID=2650926 RepID=UPI0039E26BEE
MTGGQHFWAIIVVAIWAAFIAIAVYVAYRSIPNPVTIKKPAPAPPRPYRVFTTRHDEEVHARDLVAHYEASPIKSQTIVFEHAEQWRRSNADRLDDLQIHAASDPYLTLLVDQSGSLRDNGAAKELASALLIVGSKLEAARIRYEMLGFTTVSWKGGRSRQDWIKQGRPNAPGRLCDLRHIVYKSFDEPTSELKVTLPLMTANAILKENVDGEAVLWAQARARKYENWVCVVVSDGAPVDDSTLQANPTAGEDSILTAHLVDVVASLESESGTVIGGVGLLHGIDRFYKIHGLAEQFADFPVEIAKVINKCLSQTSAKPS